MPGQKMRRFCFQLHSQMSNQNLRHLQKVIIGRKEGGAVLHRRGSNPEAISGDGMTKFRGQYRRQSCLAAQASAGFAFGKG